MPLTNSLSALDYALHDIDLEDSGKVPAFYWDTSLVRNALIGKAIYYDVDSEASKTVSTFIETRFNAENTLVYSLASAGWFGRLRLLQSHQAELIKLINRGMNIGLAEVPSGGVSQFLRDVNLHGINSAEIDHLESMAKERIASLVRLQAGEAPRLFRVVQDLRYRSWKERLSSWLKLGLFVPETMPYKYHAILNTPLFEDLYNEFAKHRPGKDENNLSDAIAMCQLQEKVEAFRVKTSQECPRFLGSSLYHRVLEQSKIKERFTYQFNGQFFTPIRTEEYFILRASVTNPTANLAKGKQAERLSNLRAELRELNRDMPGKQVESVHNLAAKSQKVADLVNRVKHYSFLEEVWLPYAAVEDVIQAIKAHMLSSKAMAESPAFQDEIDVQVTTFLSEIRDVSQEFEQIRRFAKDLNSAVRSKVDRFEHLHPEASASILGGLFRFGFSKGIQTQVDQLYRLITSDESSVRSPALLDLIRMVPSGEEEVEEEVALVASGVLWALGMHRQVRDVLGRIANPSMIPSRVFLAAAGLRLNEISNCLSVVSELENTPTPDVGDPVALATALAYLNFNLRKCYLDSSFSLNAKQLREYLDKAVSFAQKAKDLAHTDDQRVYASNQKLYYMVSAESAFSRDDIMNLAEELLRAEVNAAVWQYRYDDTLAMYYEWLSKTANDKRRWLDLAVRRAESAMKRCGGEDVEVARHLERILHSRERTTKK